MMRSIRAGLLAVLFAGTAAVAADTATVLQVAKYGAGGQLQRPADLDRWVFVGAGLGMNYDDSAFSVDHPGSFQVVLMEPSAYQYFKAHGRYADGTMFLLSFYSTDHASSIDRRGYTPGTLSAFEIHLIDRAKYTEGRAFFNFARDAQLSAAAPPGNACVQCHVPKGAFDGTFTQFYPPLRAK